MMKKALIVTTVSGFVPQFEMNNVYILQKMGYEVHYASNFFHPHYGFDNRRLEGTGIICHQVDFVRSPFWFFQNIRAYQQIKEVLSKNSFDLMHCHTPMGGVLGRLAAESLRQKWGTQAVKRKVIYTAHGFHFFRGAPLVNWIFYYSIERWLAHYTDVLITINEEDYRLAKHFQLRQSKEGQGKVERVFGVGIDLKSYQNLSANREKVRRKLGIAMDEFVFISVGELTKRKNHCVAVKAFALMGRECEERKLRYLICGEGIERKRLMSLIQRNHLTQVVTLLGYRTDIKEILAASDCFLFPSKQEGLPVALLEAKAVGLPCICSDIRGNRELAEREELVKGNNSRVYRDKIQIMLEKQKMDSRRINREMNRNYFSYSKKQVMRQMRKIYMETVRNGTKKDETGTDAS